MKPGTLDGPLDYRRWRFPECVIDVTVFRNDAGVVVAQSKASIERRNHKIEAGVTNLLLTVRGEFALSYSDWSQLERINCTVPDRLIAKAQEDLDGIREGVRAYINERGGYA